MPGGKGSFHIPCSFKIYLILLKHMKLKLLDSDDSIKILYLLIVTMYVYKFYSMQLKWNEPNKRIFLNIKFES